jgi:hypothetical protein
MLYFFIFNWKVVTSCFTRPSEWAAPAPLKTDVRHFTEAKSNHSSFITRYAAIPFSTWCSVYKHIMIGLLSIINCLYFFLLFSLLTTKIHNCHLFICCLLGSSNHQTQTPWIWHPPDSSVMNLAWLRDLRCLGLTWLLTAILQI